MNRSYQQRLQALSQLVASDPLDDQRGQFWQANFNLPSNPFPPSGIADASEENPPLRDDVTDEIIRFIDRSYRTKSTQSLILQGEYGTGKTHTLRFIEHAVNSALGSGDQGARAIYVERPRLEAHELNRTILRSLGLDTVRKYIWFALKDQVAEEITQDSQPFRDLKASLTTPPRGKKGPGAVPLLLEGQTPIMTASFAEVFDPSKLRDHRLFLERLESKRWSRESLKPFLTDCLMRVIGGTMSSELAGAFVALLLSRDEATFSSWENLTGIVKSKSLSSLSAPEFLDFLVKILQFNGVAYLYLLLDEFEEVPQGFLLTPRQRQDYLYTMREVFDRIREGIAIVMAITPGALTALTELAPPFAERNPTRVNLDAITVEDSIRLVAFFFDRERKVLEEAELNEEEHLSPLSRELLEYTFEHFPPNAQRTPRNLIQFLYRLFEHIAEKNVTSIDTNVLDEVLAQFGASKPADKKTGKGRSY